MANDATNAAIINATGQVNANIVGNSGRRKAQERAQKANIEFWNMQNEYNNPSSQMARLQGAGLNPNLIYGTSPTSAVGNADKISPAQASDVKVDNPIQDVRQFAQVRNMSQNTDNLKRQNTLLEMEAALKGAQTADAGNKAGMSAIELQKKSALYQNSLDYARESLRQLEAGTVGKTLDNTLKDEGMKDKLKEIKYRASEAQSRLKGQDLLNEMRRLEVELNQNGVYRTDNLFFRLLGRKGKEILESYRSFEKKKGWPEWNF